MAELTLGSAVLQPVMNCFSCCPPEYRFSQVGSGFLLTDTEVLPTNKHTLEGEGKIAAVANGGEQSEDF